MFQNNDIISNDDTLERLVAMTNQTNLVALDKSMFAIRSASSGYEAAASRVGSIGERIVRAAHEVGMCLPEHLRASSSMITSPVRKEETTIINNDKTNWVSWFKK